MENANFQLLVVSSDQRLPSRTVDVDSEWTAMDLKRYLSKVYPGEPPIGSQKLIFAGRILSDDSKLLNIIGHAPISKTVHLVLSPSVANQAKAAMAAENVSGYTPEQLEKLKQQYLQYLNDYYRCESGETSNTVDGLDSESENEVINVGIELDNNLDQRRENAFQRLAGALGFRGNRNIPPPEIENQDDRDEPIDLFDLAYAFFRACLLATVCVIYASWQRIALVAFIGLIFYWRNEARQNEIRRQRQNLQVAPTPNPQPQQETPQDNQDSVTTTDAAAEPSSSLEIAQQQSSDQQPTRIRQIAQALRAAGGTSIRLVAAIFTSLVPELPARIE